MFASRLLIKDVDDPPIADPDPDGDATLVTDCSTATIDADVVGVDIVDVAVHITVTVVVGIVDVIPMETTDGGDGLGVGDLTALIPRRA